jgi:hypothetical protein
MGGVGDASVPDGVQSKDHERVQTAAHHRKKRKEHASTGATAATIRAVSAQLLTFYFRAPVKAFFRPRIE